MGFLFDLGPWAWIAVGVVLVALEVTAPGAFMLWLGIAALITGLVLFIVPLGWEVAALLFAVLAAVERRLPAATSPAPAAPPSDEPMLNRRGDALVGRVVVLEEPILQGRGRVRIDDTVWRIEGLDTPAGDRVRITGVDGALLRVEAVPA